MRVDRILGKRNQEGEMEDKDIVFGSVAWQERFNRAKWNTWCHRELTIACYITPKPFDHQAAFTKYCRRQGLSTALSYYIIGKNGMWINKHTTKRGRVEHHYIESNEPMDNRKYKLKPLVPNQEQKPIAA